MKYKAGGLKCGYGKIKSGLICVAENFYMKLVFEGSIQATELVVNIVLNRSDLKVKKVVGHREIKGLEGHGVRLDIMAQDHENQAHDIEVERQDGEWSQTL